MNSSSPALLPDELVVERIHGFLDAGTTFTGSTSWREPVANYLSPERFEAEASMIRRSI